FCSLVAAALVHSVGLSRSCFLCSLPLCVSLRVAPSLPTRRSSDLPALLTGLTDRLDLLEATGLDATLVVEYTREFAAQAPEEFVRRYLVDALAVRAVVVGEDVRFGAGNAGDRATMTELGRRWGFEVRIAEDVGGDA